ncbi:Hypothetical predicted protein [Olea europaea subsp. europaea]|uniref:Pentatricopeptide repeat-containing protein n=1 Tax=Olea europaea subsp. europaea TaxID=158383 RepID=A0A8S0SMH4_OLEEU|nr:Hypothetical predicted protein [Olea europaea subsp. europaea]
MIGKLHLPSSCGLENSQNIHVRYHSMISILEKFRKFDTASALINDMRAASLLTPQALLIMIRKYTAVHDNVKDAEHLLFCNKSSFLLNTKSFNVYSYSSIMLCYLKAGNLNAVLRHFYKMKALEIEPDRKVYNAVIHAHAKGSFVKEARSLMKTKEEKGINPDTITCNSIIKPLCNARLRDEAK